MALDVFRKAGDRILAALVPGMAAAAEDCPRCQWIRSGCWRILYCCFLNNGQCECSAEEYVFLC